MQLISQLGHQLLVLGFANQVVSLEWVSTDRVRIDDTCECVDVCTFDISVGEPRSRMGHLAGATRWK